MAPKVTMLYFRGTWEQPDGLNKGIEAAIERRLPKVCRWRSVDYPARYADGMTYDESCGLGYLAGIRDIEDDDFPVIPIGYSQGGDIAGNVSANVALGKHPGLVLWGAGLFADPTRHRNQYLFDPGYRPKGYGIRGERYIAKLPVWQAVAAFDGICDLPAGNPWRFVADMSSTFKYSPSEPGKIPADGFRFIQSLEAKKLQNFWDPRLWQGWPGALAYAKGYARDGRHTKAYWEEGHIDRMADAIVEELRKRI